MLLLLLSHFIRVQLCAIPETAAHKAPLSLGFSRQEHWSGLHFLLHCMKVKSESSVVSNSSRAHGLQPTRLLHPWDIPGKNTGVGCHCLLWDIEQWDGIREKELDSEPKVLRLSSSPSLNRKHQTLRTCFLIFKIEIMRQIIEIASSSG